MAAGSDYHVELDPEGAGCEPSRNPAMKHPYCLLSLLGLLLLLGLPRIGLAADEKPPVTEDTLEALIAEVEATADLAEDTKTRLTELYRKSLTNLEKQSSYEAKSQAFREAGQTASDETEATRRKIEETRQTSATGELPISDQTPLSEIEQLLLKEKANRTAVQAKLKDIEAQLSREAGRPAAARDRISKAVERREAIADELRLKPPTDQPADLTEARRWVLQTEDAALASEISMLDQELLSQPPRLELLKAKREKNVLSLERIDERIQLLETMLGGKRLAEAERAIAEAATAQREAMGKHRLVRELAEQNAALSEEVGSLAGQLEEIAKAEAHASRAARRLADELSNTEQKVELAGMSQALGRVLLEQRRRLPNPRLYRAQAEEREARISEISLSQIQHEEERRALRDIDSYVDNLVAELPSQEAAEIRGELRTLAESRRQLLAKAIDTEQAVLRALGELDFAQRQLLDTVEAYTQFLAERLLWIRSSAPPGLEMLTGMGRQTFEFLSPGNWLDVLKSVGRRAMRSPVVVITLAVFGFLLWKAKALRRRLQATGQQVGKLRTDSYLLTLEALGLTLLLAAPWPLLLAVVGWQLSIDIDATVFSKAVAGGLTWVANAYFYLESFRLLCYPKGLAEAHFCWPQTALKALRRSLVRLMIVFLPAAFVGRIIITVDTPAMGGGLGRLCFVIVLVAIGLFFYRLFDPRKGVLAPVMARHPKSLLARLRHLWLALGILVPTGLAVLGVAGYLYTAGTLTGTLIDTMWFVLVLVVIHQLVIRWLLLMRRRLLYQAAVKKRELAKTAAESSPAPGSEELPEIEPQQVDLDSLGEDSRKLLSTALEIVGIIGIWLIWSPVLPAFGVMDDITLWNYLGTVDGEEQRIPVTVADAGLALLILVVTIVSTKRFPALLEIGLLQRLTMTPGGRYAATTLARYSIAAIGTVFVFGTLGASWSQIQWLVAALGVGIGFGLQEIVANFFSGLIILFERPIRVGDTVTVADTTGLVTRIRIRATTIRNWDGQELLVPNKEFITSRLLNWTLSDPTTRLVLPVGLVYGGDVDKAMALMLEAAKEHPGVLDDPRPWVSFDEFGDNALSLKLRCFVPSMENRLATFSALHEAINRKFNEAGLVIAFPQRDVHLDTSKPLDIRIHREKGQPDAV
jgi:potassium efflux system protein